VRDTAGNPSAGQSCVFSIESEPGTDAALGSKVAVRLTDANGVATATLFTGTTPGVIVVKVQAGELNSTVIVDVAGAVAPPAAPVEISPPSTGDAGLAAGR
jgi:hypothetical protein